MRLGRYHDRDAPVCEGPIGTGGDTGKMHPRRKTFQVRFLAACAKGHIQDFPWVEWIFSGSPAGWWPDGNDRWLRMITTGSASLAGVTVQAEERVAGGTLRTVAKKNLAAAFVKDESPVEGGAARTALSRVNVYCRGVNQFLL